MGVGPCNMTINVRPIAIEEGSRQNVDQVTQMRFDLRSSARPALFSHLTDLCISVIWSGPNSANSVTESTITLQGVN